MARSLVIVESPAKAKTINKYLGRNYLVKASYGHVMDLPKKNIGILLPPDPESKTKKKKKKKAKADAKPAPKPVVVTAKNIFEPTYEVIPNKIKVINDLRKAASTADAVYLAGDPDREGEAICAHLEEILSNPRQYSNLVEPKEDGEEAKEPPKKEAKVTAPAKETKNFKIGQRRRSENLSRDVQRNHAESHQGRLRKPDASECQSGRRAAGPPRA